jgi:phage FluMu protein Com
VNEFLNVRCQQCSKLLCRVSADFLGVIELRCRHCKHDQRVSLATILKQLDTDCATLPPESARTIV